ncbi:hypothetical protein KAT36_02315 [Candidatus Pacearchaeota archaeon]|nr:hypothetical protein [Candidatus Pacearchaeota archaeon]
MKVWKFTNGRELNKNEFLNYFERKVFRTIRRFQMLPKNKLFTLKKSNDLNTATLKQILQTKFQLKHSTSPNISADNLSQIAEDIFKNIIRGKFHYPLPTAHCPLLYLSDKEVKLYAKLKNIKGTKRKQDKNIQSLFNKFLKKNQDLELNILKSALQLNEKSSN